MSEWKEYKLEDFCTYINNGYTASAKEIPVGTTLEEIKALDYIIRSGGYVGLPEELDDFNFEERYTWLKDVLIKQIKEEDKLNKVILKQLDKIELNN